MNNVRNSVRLIGRLGIDPEMKELKDGKKVARISLATSETFKDENGNRTTETQWHNLVAWGKTAEIADRYLKKGKEVAVEGKLIYRNYQDKEGKKHYVTEVVINELVMLGSKKDGSA